MGLFITFEGIEGCGKTTQLHMAGDYLSRLAVPFISTVEPGGTALGNSIRNLLLNSGAPALCAGAELLLFCAARAQHVSEVIAPALMTGKIVLCDRFSDATLVYQGYGRGLDRQYIKTLSRFAAQNLEPDLTLLFDLPVETGLARAWERISRNGNGHLREDRFEREAVAFHHKIREGYLSLAREAPGRFRVIDGCQDIEAIRGEVRRHLEALIGERGYVL